MEGLLYKVIKSEEQHRKYRSVLEKLLALPETTCEQQDVIELLTLLINTWNQDCSSDEDKDPIVLLKHLMATHKIRGIDMAALLGVSKSLISDILHYRRGLSKEMIRKLAIHFKLSQEVFNRPYSFSSETK